MTLLRNAGLLAICGTILVVTTSCGFRSDPQPLTGVIPATEDVAARFREEKILVSWKQPPSGLSRLRGAVKAYDITVKRLPLGCIECRPIFEQLVSLRADSPELSVEGQTVYFEWKPLGPPTQWLVQVQTRFTVGESALPKAVFVEGISQVPVHSLAFEPLPGSKQVRLYWRARQEREVQVLTPGGATVVRPSFYRANVYRRLLPAPWPLTPLNPAPVDTLQYLVQPPASAAKGGPGSVEYTIRLVDQFGNEGPPAQPVSFAAVPGEAG